MQSLIYILLCLSVCSHVLPYKWIGQKKHVNIVCTSAIYLISYVDKLHLFELM